MKRCDELARKLRFFREEVEKAGHAAGRGGAASGSAGFELGALEAELESLERDLMDMNANSQRLLRSHAELQELSIILDTAGPFFTEARGASARLGGDSMAAGGGDPTTIESPLMGGGGGGVGSAAPAAGGGSRLGFVAGMLPSAKSATFERVLFRATRGNMFLKRQEVGRVVDPSSGEKNEKLVFVVFFSGERARTKVAKICDAFGANRYPFPEDPERQRQMEREVSGRLRELQMTLDSGETQREALLRRVGGELAGWMQTVREEKAVYHTLNQFSIDVTRKALVGEGWVPVDDLEHVQEALREATAESNADVPTVFQQLRTKELPPTYFKTNKWTNAFQEIINSYGIATYREPNPAVYSVVTFPFLFAVMFGDVGHGFLLLFASLFLVLREKQLGKQDLGEIVGMAFGGRYVLLLMSVFAIYMGFIYNECFSMPLSLFGKTQWECDFESCATQLNTKYAEVANSTWATTPERVQEMWVEHGQCACPLATDRSTPYVFGVDPAWHGTKTELTFINSVKMKMSIILGVAQMTLGIVCSLYKFLKKPIAPDRYEVDRLSIICEFVPQILFLMAMFGYLSALIIAKWITGSTADLFFIMVNLFLAPGTNTCGDGCPETDPLYGLGPLNGFLVFICMVCVPWMLFPKPFILKKRHETKSNGGSGDSSRYEMLDDMNSNGLVAEAADHSGEEEFEFQEVFVHQMIHTIEFVLGAVSNTASYLRLWALSLAHSQLSDVFYKLVLMSSIQMKSPTAIFVGVFVWAMATFAVLMIMETLSAFLHALRLHWVEYMNKFYNGDGKLFSPFSFTALAAEAEASAAK